MLTINEPLILATKKNYDFDDFSMHKSAKGEVSGRLILVLRDDKLERVLDTKVFILRGAEWDEFWIAFNSGKFLYQKGTGLTNIPDSIEQEFLNVKTVEPEELSPVEPPLI
jgi:hypothetical protein